MRVEAAPSARSVLAGMWGILRVRWLTLLVAGFVIFVPLGLLETADASISEAVDEQDSAGVLGVLEVLGIGALHTVGAVVGEVVFAGVVTAVVLIERRDERSSLGATLQELSLGRLALADVAYVTVTVLGALALIVPGLVFLVWFALLGPVIEVEHLGVRDAFRRSRQLVRMRPWLVAAFVIPILVLNEALANLAHEAGISWLGETFGGEWAAAGLAELLTSLPLALAVVVLYFELSGISPACDERQSSPRTPPPGSPRSHPAEPA